MDTCNSWKCDAWIDYPPTAEGRAAIIHDHGPVPEMPQALQRRIKLKTAPLAALKIEAPEEELGDL